MHTHTHMHARTHAYTHTHTHIHVQSFMDWTEMDVKLWMESVNIVAYLNYFKAAGIRKGADLQAVDLQTLQVCSHWSIILRSCMTCFYKLFPIGCIGLRIPTRDPV